MGTSEVLLNRSKQISDTVNELRALDSKMNDEFLKLHRSFEDDPYASLPPEMESYSTSELDRKIHTLLFEVPIAKDTSPLYSRVYSDSESKQNVLFLTANEFEARNINPLKGQYLNPIHTLVTWVNGERKNVERFNLSKKQWISLTGMTLPFPATITSDIEL